VQGLLLTLSSEVGDTTNVSSIMVQTLPPFTDKWNSLFQNITKMSADNKLRHFSFKLLHRILGTKKELKRYKLKPENLFIYLFFFIFFYFFLFFFSFAKVQIPSNTHSWLALSPRTFTTKWWYGSTTNRNPNLIWLSRRSLSMILYYP